MLFTAQPAKLQTRSLAAEVQPIVHLRLNLEEALDLLNLVIANAPDGNPEFDEILAKLAEGVRAVDRSSVS